MRSCEEVARLISLSQEQKLTFGQRLELKFHTMICGPCKDFSANINTIRQSMQRFNQKDKDERKGRTDDAE